jgi:hypothetical protein
MDFSSGPLNNSLRSVSLPRRGGGLGWMDMPWFVGRRWQGGDGWLVGWLVEWCYVEFVHRAGLEFFLLVLIFLMGELGVWPPHEVHSFRQTGFFFFAQLPTFPNIQGICLFWWV